MSATGNTLTIYISAPKGYQQDSQLADTVAAEQLAFGQYAGQVTAYKLRLVVLDKRTKLSGNARTAVSDKGAIAYIGDLQPADSEQSAGITNAQDLLQVSPTDTALELTQRTPAVPNGPKYFYESYSTYGKTFARVVPNTSVEAKAIVAEMKLRGVTQLYLSDDGSFYGAALAQAIRQAATPITLTTSKSSANGIFYGAAPDSAAAPNSEASAARVFMADASANPTAKLFGSSSLANPAFTAALTTPPAQLYVSSPGVLTKDQPPAYTQFASAFSAKYGHAPASIAAFGYEAMSAVISSIAHAGHHAFDRALVVHNFDHITNRSSAVGTYSMDSGGDSNLRSFVFSRIKNGALVPFASAQG
ncbi:MAG: type 1 periplasmic-binding domain-containing protein [Solirubrobacteraceae bacterium]